MCEWIAQAQRAYTRAHVESCQVPRLRKLKGILYPEPAPGFKDHSSGGPREPPSDEPATSPAGSIEEFDASPILGMYSFDC